MAQKASSKTASSRAERARAANQARRRKEARRRQLMIGGTVLLVVAVIVGVMVAVSMSGGKKKNAASGAQGGVSASVMQSLTSAPINGVPDNVSSQLTLPKPVSGHPPLTAGGKPEVLYIGAEFCPYCAAERWPMIIALSRFGTFSGLAQSHSSPSDTYPNTPTFTFRNATYTSKYITAKLIENEDENHNQIQPVSAADMKLWTGLMGQTAYPFIDIANKYWTSVDYDPQLLHGKTFQQIAQSVSNPSTVPGSAINGVANNLTATICKVTGNQPANVCSAAPIKAIEQKLGG